MNFPLIIPDNSTGLAEDILDNVLILIENSLSVYSEAKNFMKLYLKIQNSEITKSYFTIINSFRFMNLKHVHVLLYNIFVCYFGMISR